MIHILSKVNFQVCTIDSMHDPLNSSLKESEINVNCKSQTSQPRIKTQNRLSNESILSSNLINRFKSTNLKENSMDRRGMNLWKTKANLPKLKNWKFFTNKHKQNLLFKTDITQDDETVQFFEKIYNSGLYNGTIFL